MPDPDDSVHLFLLNVSILFHTTFMSDRILYSEAGTLLVPHLYLYFESKHKGGDRKNSDALHRVNN